MISFNLLDLSFKGFDIVFELFVFADVFEVLFKLIMKNALF